jgi:hypothetical protein
MTDFRREAALLGALPAEKTKVVRSAIQFGSARVKDSWRQKAIASSGAHARLYPYKITYDTRILATSVLAEIGPVAEGQGELGPVLEFGSQKSPPTLDGLHTLSEEAPRIERAIDAVMGFDGFGIFK